MARVQTSRSLTMPLLYNIDQPVGYGHPNKPDDVALVQYLLKVAYEGRKQLHLPGWASYTATKPMIVDGRFGPITHEHIQEYYVAIVKAVPLPGRRVIEIDVHPARSFALQRTGNLGIIVSLNVHFQQLRPKDYLHLGAASDLTPALSQTQLCIG